MKERRRKKKTSYIEVKQMFCTTIYILIYLHWISNYVTDWLTLGSSNLDLFSKIHITSSRNVFIGS